MKISPSYETKELGMLFTILRSFCSYLELEVADIQPKNRPMKIPGNSVIFGWNSVELPGRM